MIQFEWILAEQAPEDWYAPVLYVTGNNKLRVFKDTLSFCGNDYNDKSTHRSQWKRLKEKYNVKFWVYQSQLL